MSMQYDIARRAFERLEEIAELDDQVELDAKRLDLMQNPSKAFAAKMYESAIQAWFGEHGTESAPEDIVSHYA